ncbi:MAG: LamG-like jellyroll fold domain-containing protein, partial [Candidatus Hodarchaeota archaeon]
MNFNHHMILLIILVVCSLNISCNSYSLADAEKRTINYLKRKPSNLVAYWDFDEGSGSTVTDQSGNGNDGTVTGATWVTGKNGSALLFSDSATGDYVQVADSNSLDPSTALTIEAWIKADTFDGDGATSGNIIISKWVDWSIGKAQFLLTAFTGGGLAFKINGVQARHDLRVENQLSEGVWHHILATWNEHDIILAVDGEIVAHESSLVTSMYSTEYDQDHLRIGYLSDSTYIGAKKWQFKGVIDEVSIYHDFYDDFHNINPPEVLYPDGGEVLRGRTTIQWTAATDLLNHSVTYDVSYATDRGGYYWTVIASGLTGTTYQWDTTTVANGSLYLIKVKAICTAGSNAQDESDSFFTIQNPKHTLPAPTISYPNGGETLDGAVPIQWTSAVDTCTWNHSVSYNLYYSPNNGATWSLLAFNLSGNNYPWNTSTVLNGEYYLIRVVATCLEGITSSDISDSSFAVYNWIPQIRLSNLINNTAHQPHTLISFNITDDAGISSVSYHWDDASTNSTFNASYTVSLPSSNGSHILHVYANNTLNHWAYRCFVFITDIDAPIISLESLQNGTYQQPATPIYLTVIDDFMVKSVRYNWDGASYTTFSTSYVALLPSIIGQHFLRVYANDTAGNWATALFMFFSDDGTLDSDTDDLCDLWELENGLNPYDDDTDDDGITDGVEVMFNLDPLNPDTDGDGLSDGAEVNTWDTLPMVADTDNDGINDGREIELGLDPNKPDTDGDGDLDG